MSTAPVARIVSIAPEHCPLCDSALTRDQSVVVQGRMREAERRKLEQQRRELDEQLRRQQEAIRIEALQQARAEASAMLAVLRRERDAALEAARTVEQRAADLRRQGFEAARAEAEARIITVRAERDAALAEAECARQRVEEERRTAVEKAVRAARESQEREYERERLVRAAELARERESFQKKIDDMQRLLARKTANELGDEAEIDLFEQLREAFPDDRVTRVQKGEPGADVRLEVRYKGAVAGAILFDSKNRKAWQNTFAAKLRKDQLDDNADHAILSTTAFPSGRKELCIESGVIVVRPARVRELVQILRCEIIKAHVGGLANQQRAEKKDALYRYIGSEQYRQKAAEAGRLASELLDLDALEAEEHRRRWEKRARLLRQQQRALSEVSVEISAIIEGPTA